MSPPKLYNLKNLGSWGTYKGWNGSRSKRKDDPQAKRSSLSSKNDKENISMNDSSRRTSSRLTTVEKIKYIFKRPRKPSKKQDDSANNHDASRDASINNYVTRQSAEVAETAHPHPLSVDNSLSTLVNEPQSNDLVDDTNSVASIANTESTLDGEPSTPESSADQTTSSPPLQFKGVESEFRWIKPPTQQECIEALHDIRNILHPRRDESGKRRGYKASKVTGWSHGRLRDIEEFLVRYTSNCGRSEPDAKGSWRLASDAVVAGKGKKTGKNSYSAKALRRATRDFIASRKAPENPFTRWNTSIIDGEEFQQEVSLYLQTKGKFVRASDIVFYTKRPEVQAEWGIDGISFSTAKYWMKKLGYRWLQNHKGLYVDGHEREDVVTYRKTKYLPSIRAYYACSQHWTGNDLMTEEPLSLPPGTRPVVLWFHNESTFYAHDRRTAHWVAEGECPTPYVKGEGVSLMVADFVSAKYGWLRSPDGSESARRIFRAGKHRDGYFNNTDILSQVKDAMLILKQYYPGEDHVFVYDNATIHQKRAENALSARNMPKWTPQNGKNWGITVTRRAPDGSIVYMPDGKPEKVKIRMGDGLLATGEPQCFYFPDNHPAYPGIFKGMAVILEERGVKDAQSIRAECKDFKCPSREPNVPRSCCCRRILYEQHDFVYAKSLLEELCQYEGFDVLYLPKFHCELNFIEMCWGRAKYHYQMNPPSSKEEDLERNMVTALEAVTLTEMRRFSRRSQRFADAYHQGLTGRQAVWACKKYRGHRALPATIMAEFDAAHAN